MPLFSPHVDLPAVVPRSHDMSLQLDAFQQWACQSPGPSIAWGGRKVGGSRESVPFPIHFHFLAGVLAVGRLLSGLVEGIEDAGCWRSSVAPLPQGGCPSLSSPVPGSPVPLSYSGDMSASLMNCKSEEAFWVDHKVWAALTAGCVPSQSLPCPPTLGSLLPSLFLPLYTTFPVSLSLLLETIFP